MSALEVSGVSKRFGSLQVLRDINLSLEKGQMLALIGRSGSGKSTLLRCMNGLEHIDAGSITIGGHSLSYAPAALRRLRQDVGIVFQAYNLFPHLTVGRNIMLAPRLVLGWPTDRAEARAREVLATVGLSEKFDAYPDQLSGGQQQRVAVARALVINPSILLLDEPFSNLDAKLRESTGLELRRIQRELGLTSIFVTHDQNEAMAIADRIAVMNGGAVEQIGSAIDIYERPRTRFVADFIGSANFMPATVEARDGNVVTLRHGLGVTVLPVEGQDFDKGRPVTLMVRPECVAIHPAAAEAGLGTIETISYQGSSAHIFVKLREGDRTMLVERHGRELAGLEVGKTVDLNVKAQDMTLFAA